MNSELPRILELNENALPHVNSIALEDMAWFLDHAAYFKAIDDAKGALMGFLIALRPGLKYASDNYRWFSSTYDNFYYIDRIVIAEEGRGQGFGGLLYRDVIKSAQEYAPRLTCEVNSRPPNPQSMAFHESFGFAPVGIQQTEGGAKEVTLMSLDLE